MYYVLRLSDNARSSIPQLNKTGPPNRTPLLSVE